MPFFPSPRHTRVNSCRAVIRSTVEREQHHRADNCLGEIYGESGLGGFFFVCVKSSISGTLLTHVEWPDPGSYDHEHLWVMRVLTQAATSTYKIYNLRQQSEIRSLLTTFPS